MQLVTVATNLRLRQWRSLRAIERNLAVSDPSLTRLFCTFTRLSHGEEKGPAEKINAQPLRALARRLATALEFDLADPWRQHPPPGPRRAALSGGLQVRAAVGDPGNPSTPARNFGSTKYST
jgi:hypothetical protein